MKFQTDVEPSAFIPKTISITFETQKELDTFGLLFNSIKVCMVLEEMSGVGNIKLHEAFLAHGANIDHTELLETKLRARLS